MAEPTAIHPDIPLDKAWKTGRRIYVRAAYQSRLNDQLRDLGAKWDGEVKALWVGTGKADQVVPLVQAQVERVAETAAVKAAGRWMYIPYEATAIRAKAKALGGRYDGDRKDWAMPTPEAQDAIRQMLVEWDAQQQAAKAVAKAAEYAARQAVASASAADRTQQVIAASDRTVTEERGTANGRLVGRMRRPEAEQRKPQPGELRQLRDGRRVLVLTSRVEFVSQDAIDDGITSLDLDADPGWYFSYQYAVVEPTADEAEQDRRDRAERDDQDQIAAVMREAERAAQVHEVDMFTRVDGPSITRDAAGGMTIHGGKVTVAADGAVWWQHPGWYDDYRHVEGPVTDAALADRIRAVIAAGTRRRGQYQVDAG